jgi:hypothetical protein
MILSIFSITTFTLLHVLTPKQMEPPFLVTQLVVMGVFIWLGVVAVRGFRA